MKMIVPISTMVAVFLISGFGCQEKGIVESSGGWIEGIIYDTETQNALDSVEITLARQNPDSSENKVLSDSMGHYILFSGFTAGDFVVKAVKFGYISKTMNVIIIKNDTVTLNFELDKE